MTSWLARILQGLLRRHKLRQMVRRLGHALPRRYGIQESYRVKRIRFTCDELKIGADLWESAEATFASQEQFCAAYTEESRGTSKDGRALYRRLRDQVASANGGDYRFLPTRMDLADTRENSDFSSYHDNV